MLLITLNLPKCRYPFLILWYTVLGPACLTDKDKADFKALLDPDIFCLIKISAIGMEVCE
jgi:hypothetical protein